MTTSDKKVEEDDFLFTISRSDNQIDLIGLNGTTWETLGFSHPNPKHKQYFNQFGMTK